MGTTLTLSGITLYTPSKYLFLFKHFFFIFYNDNACLNPFTMQFIRNYCEAKNNLR